MAKTNSILVSIWTILLVCTLFTTIALAEDVELNFTFLDQEIFTETNQPYNEGDRGVTIRSYSDPKSFPTFDLDTCSEPFALKNGFAGEMGCSDGDDLRFYLNNYTSDRISVNVGISESIYGDDITATLKGYANVGGNMVAIPDLAAVSLYLGSGTQHIDDNILVLEDSQGRIGAFTISYGYNCEVEKIDCVSIHVYEDTPPPPDDPDPPIITITTPEDGAVYGRSMIMVSGTVEETVGLQVLQVYRSGFHSGVHLDNQLPPEYRFAQMIRLVEGTNEISVRALDIGDNRTIERRTVTFTPYPPPPPAPPADLDIEATGMEITQGIQGWNMIHYTDYVDNDTSKLISGKKTLVRVYGEAKGTSVDIEGVVCKLEGFIGGQGGTPLPGSPIYSFDPVTLAAGENYIQQRPNSNKSFNFIIPDSWTQPGHITLVATVNSGQPIKETIGRYDARNSHYKDILFHDTEEYCLFLYRINKVGDPAPTLNECYENLTLLEQIYPVAPEKLNIIDAGTFNHPSWYDLDDYGDLSKALRRFRRHCGFRHGSARAIACANETYLGLTHDTNRHRGVTHYKFPVSLSVASTDSNAGTNFYYQIKSGHETGHARDLGHVDSYSDDCSNGESGYNHEPKDPYENYNIQRDPSGLLYDAASIGQWGVNIHSDNTFDIVSPWNNGDMMSYCGSRWMSVHTWNRLADNFIPDKSTPAIPEEYNSHSKPLSKADATYLIIDGIIQNSETGDLYPAWQSNFKEDLYDYEGEGKYAISLIGKEFNTLFTRRFDKAPMYDAEDFSSFSQIVPFMKGIKSICLTGPSGFQTICISAGSQSPSVMLKTPNGGGTFPATGNMKASWTAADPDGDNLIYSLLYSNDNGDNWQVVQDEIEDTNALVVLDQLPGGNGTCLLKILATDGINQGENIISTPFTKGNVPPVVKILSPRSVTVYKRKTPVTFKAMASDIEDRTLVAENMNWYSDKDGYLGSGKVLETLNLGSGMHKITFKGFDLDEKSARDTTQIYIEPTPYADIKDAAEEGPRNILPSDPIKIICTLDAAQDVIDGDYWLFIRTPSNNTYYWHNDGWTGQEIPWRDGKIEDLAPMTVLEPTGEDLPGGVNGNYVFFFGVDTIQDGYINWSDFYYDTITIIVNPCQSDLDGDNDVDGSDIYLLLQNFANGCLESFARIFGF